MSSHGREFTTFLLRVDPWFFQQTQWIMGITCTRSYILYNMKSAVLLLFRAQRTNIQHVKEECSSSVTQLSNRDQTEVQLCLSRSGRNLLLQCVHGFYACSLSCVIPWASEKLDTSVIRLSVLPPPSPPTPQVSLEAWRASSPPQWKGWRRRAESAASSRAWVKVWSALWPNRWPELWTSPQRRHRRSGTWLVSVTTGGSSLLPALCERSQSVQYHIFRLSHWLPVCRLLFYTKCSVWNISTLEVSVFSIY